MIKAGNTVFKAVRILIVLLLVLTVIYAAATVFVFLYPNTYYKIGVFLKAHGLAQADSSNPFNTPTSLNLGNTTQTSPPAQTTGSNFGLGTGVTQNPTNSPISNFGSSASQPLTSSGGGNGTLQYIPLAPIPGITDKLSGGNISASTGVDGFKKYIQGIFTFGIGLCAALAVIMIIYGGFMYVVNSGNEGKIKEGRDIIKNAVEGLVMALCIVIILQAVNSSLLTGDIFSDFKNESVGISSNALYILPGDPGNSLSPNNPNYGTIVNANGQVFPGTTPSSNVDNSSGIRSLVNQGTTFPNQDWNNYALQQIQQSGLLNLSPSDAQSIFGTSQPTADDYLHLLASMSSKESDFNAGDITAHDVNNTDSVGLLSMSSTDSWARKDGYSEQDLLNPYNNIQVGVQTLNSLVQSGGCISCTNSSGKPIGAGAYWSTVRPLNSGNGG